jgi:hypothetical protein
MTANIRTLGDLTGCPIPSNRCVIGLKYTPTSTFCSCALHMHHQGRCLLPQACAAACRACCTTSTQIARSSLLMWCLLQHTKACAANCSSVPCRPGLEVRWPQAVPFKAPQAQQRQSCALLTSRAALLQEQQAAPAGGEQEASSTTGWSCDAGSMQRPPDRSVPPRSNSSGEPVAATAAVCLFDCEGLMAMWALLGLLADTDTNMHTVTSNCRQA